MKETIREIFKGNSFSLEKCGMDNEAIKALRCELSRVYERMIEKIGEENELIVEEYEDLCCDLNMLFYEEFFIKGFEIGHKIALEILTK